MNDQDQLLVAIQRVLEMRATTELRELERAATPAPWQYLRKGSWGGSTAIATRDGYPLFFTGDPDVAGVDEDNVLIVAARNVLPDLLDGLDQLRTERDELRYAIKLALLQSRHAEGCEVETGSCTCWKGKLSAVIEHDHRGFVLDGGGES